MNKVILGSAKTPLLAMKGPATTGPAIVTCPETTFPLVVSMTMVPPSEQPGQLLKNVAETSNVVSAFAAPILRARAHDAAASAALIFNFMTVNPLDEPPQPPPASILQHSAVNCVSSDKPAA